jgi:hypothetical protein
MNREELAVKIQKYLNGIGIHVESESSEYSTTLHGIVKSEGQTIRLVTHIAEREVKPGNYEVASNETTIARRANVVIRPTLAGSTSIGPASAGSVKEAG